MRLDRNLTGMAVSYLELDAELDRHCIRFCQRRPPQAFIGEAAEGSGERSPYGGRLS